MSQIPIQQAAKLLKLSGRRIQILAKEGILPKAKHGHYDSLELVHAYIDYLRDCAATNRSGTTNSLSDARAKESRTKTKLMQIEIETKERTRIPVEEVRKHYDATMGTLNRWLDRQKLPRGEINELKEDLLKTLTTQTLT